MADDEAAGKHPSTDLTDEELEEKLTALEAKAKAAGSRRMPEVPEWNYQRQRKRPEEEADYRSLGVGMSAAYALLGGMVTGWVAGFGVDHFAHSAPTGQAIGGLLGAVAGMVYVFMLVSRESK